MKRRKKKQVDEDNGFGAWGGYMEAKILKLEEQYLEQLAICKQNDLFNGISIFVNGFTKPSADELKRIMLTHGGIFHHYQRPHTSFVIATNLPDVKIKTMKLNHKIVKPDWIVDCIKESKILDYSNYLLYTNKTAQPKLYTKIPISSTVPAINEIKINDSQSSISDELNILNEKLVTDSSIFDNKNDSIVIDGNTDDEEDKSSVISVDSVNTVISLTSNISEMQNDTQQEIIEDINEKSLETITKPDNLENKKVLLESRNVEANVTSTTTTSMNTAITAADPNFIKEFFNNSRLHHIATLGANFKQLINDLREKHTGSFPLRKTLKASLNPDPHSYNLRKFIMHIDMDCFFVSVGLRSRSHLRGLPVAVAHSKGSNAGQSSNRKKLIKEEMTKNEIETDLPLRLDGIDNLNSMSEIASCSYEARKMGIKNGMFVGAALKLCPDLHTIPYDFEEYINVATALYDTVTQYTLEIEAVSCDEMFVDLTGLLNDVSITCWSFVQHLREEIKQKTGCPCSAGVGENKLQARLATRAAKPNGQFIMKLEEIDKHIATLSVSDLPGVGYSTLQKLKNLNCNFCADLKRIKLPILQKHFHPKLGQKLYDYSRGIDKNQLVYNHIRKTVSAEVNYGIRLNDQQQVDNFLKELCEEVHKRLKDISKRAKGITLKLMVRSKDAPIETAKYLGHGICDTITKSTNLNNFTDNLSDINEAVCKMIKQLNIMPKELRGIGIHITNLDNTSKTKQSNNTIKSMFNQKNNENNNTVKVDNDNKYEKIVDAMQPSCSWSTPVAMNPVIPSNTFEYDNEDTLDISNASMYGLDINILKELPPNIVHEILNDELLREQQKIISKTTKRRKYNKRKKDEKFNVEKFLVALPQELRSEVLRDLEEQDQNYNATKLSANNEKEEIRPNIETKKTSISQNNILLQDWRKILQEWLNSTDNPEISDVDIVSSYINEFISARNINDIYVVLRYLHRIISERGDCGWHKAYYQLYDDVQQQMQTVYKGKLKIPNDIECKAVCYLLYKNKTVKI